MKYLIMGQLAGIGGWQLYIDARASYLADRGFDVCLISISKEEDIKLPSFLRFQRLCIPEVHMPPASYTKKQARTILKKIYDFLGSDCGEMLIETTAMQLSMWGEAVARHYNAAHFSYLLHSHFPPQSRDVQDFFLFKYERGELAGMSELTLPELFRGHPAAAQIEPRNLPAMPKDPISDDGSLDEQVSFMRQRKEHGAAVIGYFGNLDKPHFPQLCDFIARYANENGDRQFLFVTIGSSGTGKQERKQKSVEMSADNCKTLNIPALYPVPRSVFQAMDVCAASWGCAENAARAGALTIRLLDDVTIIPQGIMGVTVTDYKSPRCAESLTELLDGALAGKYGAKDAAVDSKRYDYTVTHEQNDKTIFGGSGTREYYDIERIRYVSRRSRIEKTLNSICGVALTQTVVKCMKKILAKPYAMLQRKETYAK